MKHIILLTNLTITFNHYVILNYKEYQFTAKYAMHKMQNK